MKAAYKFVFAAVAISPLLVIAPAFAAGKTPVVRLETMTIVGKRAAPAVSDAPTAQAKSAAAPLARLETMVIVGHRAGGLAGATLAHASSESIPTRAYPL